MTSLENIPPDNEVLVISLYFAWSDLQQFTPHINIYLEIWKACGKFPLCLSGVSYSTTIQLILISNF
jgi:hypothetical protein